MHRRQPPAPLTPHPPPHNRCRRLFLARMPAAANPRQADCHLQPGTTRADIPPERPAKPDAPATVHAGGRSHGSAGSQGASGKRKSSKALGSREHTQNKGEGVAAAAPRNLRCLQVSAGCVQPQPSRQPGGRRQTRIGFACRRACHQRPAAVGRGLHRGMPQDS